MAILLRWRAHCFHILRIAFILCIFHKAIQKKRTPDSKKEPGF